MTTVSVGELAEWSRSLQHEAERLAAKDNASPKKVERLRKELVWLQAEMIWTGSV